MTSTALILHASGNCPACHGRGQLENVPCSCALRSIHDQLLEDYQEMPISGQLPDVEQHEAYRADLEQCARACLTMQEHWIWRLHHVHRIGLRGMITFFRQYGIDEVTVRDLLHRAKAKVGLQAVQTGLFQLRVD